MTKHHIDLTGKRFGRLVVLKPKAHRYWLCICDCGNEKPIRQDHLLHGKITSCRCFQREVVSKIATTHGACKNGNRSNTYSIWSKMRSRCHNPSDKLYRYYGARGISVCKKWRNNYAEFVKDIGERPCKSLSLDRINNNGNYEPGNVRWATRDEQATNKRNNLNVTYKGRTMCVAAWSRIVGLNKTTLYRRIVAGWPVEKAMTLPTMQSGNRTNH